jgi:hypothetical protein
MKAISVLIGLCLHECMGFRNHGASLSRLLNVHSSNSDLFGAPAIESPSAIPAKDEAVVIESRSSQAADRLLTEAQRLRKEAAELEVALREEARAKGLPEEIINKLVPITAAKKPPAVVVAPEVKLEGFPCNSHFRLCK